MNSAKLLVFTEQIQKECHEVLSKTNEFTYTHFSPHVLLETHHPSVVIKFPAELFVTYCLDQLLVQVSVCCSFYVFFVSLADALPIRLVIFSAPTVKNLPLGGLEKGLRHPELSLMLAKSCCWN
ncbi:hypothetical protein ILYODFUR_018965 [Ilyodon furcidens]|uniref:Uncharacterized protein n=1 Tax=Ilyodon furcidens TaxID=33524 RepID=A0ABV0UVI2_9TELE